MSLFKTTAPDVARLRLRLHLPLALGLACLASACGNSTPTTGTGTRAALQLTVDPNPVPPSLNTLTGVVSIGYKITITETQGLGGEIQFVLAQVYDPETGALVSLTYFDSADLVVFVGKSRIEPLGTLVVPQTASYTLPDLRTNALLTVHVQMKDDRENLINQSLLVKVQPAS
jgi:hypothetical protein